MKFYLPNLGRGLTISFWLLFAFSLSVIAQDNNSISKTDFTIAAGVENSFYAFGSLGYKGFEFEPMISLFSNRLSEQYSQIKLTYGKEVFSFLNLSVVSGINRGIIFENLFTATKAKFEHKAYHLILGVDYTYNINQKESQLNYFYELEIDIFPQIALAYYYQPLPAWSFNRNHELGIHFKQPRLSVTPAVLIDQQFDLQKAMFIISFLYSVK